MNYLIFLERKLTLRFINMAVNKFSFLQASHVLLRRVRYKPKSQRMNYSISDQNIPVFENI